MFYCFTVPTWNKVFLLLLLLMDHSLIRRCDFEKYAHLNCRVPLSIYSFRFVNQTAKFRFHISKRRLTEVFSKVGSCSR